MEYLPVGRVLMRLEAAPNLALGLPLRLALSLKLYDFAPECSYPSLNLTKTTSVYPTLTLIQVRVHRYRYGYRYGYRFTRR